MMIAEKLRECISGVEALLVNATNPRDRDATANVLQRLKVQLAQQEGAGSIPTSERARPQASTPPRDANGRWTKKPRGDGAGQQETRTPASQPLAFVAVRRSQFVCPDPSSTRQLLTLAEERKLKVTFPGMVVELCGPIADVQDVGRKFNASGSSTAVSRPAV